MTAINQKVINWTELHAREGQLFSLIHRFSCFVVMMSTQFAFTNLFGRFPNPEAYQSCSNNRRTSRQTKTLRMMSTNPNFDPTALTFKKQRRLELPDRSEMFTRPTPNVD